MNRQRPEKDPQYPVAALAVREILFAVADAFRAPVTDPPAGSNRPLAIALSRLLIVGVIPLMVIMVVGGWLDANVTVTSTVISVAWLSFVTIVALIWNRLAERWIRYVMLAALFFLQLRWTAGWLVLDGQDVFTAVLVGLIFTPLLLFTTALMEGRRNGVIIGFLVASNMAIAVGLGSTRESLELMHLADMRLAFPTFVVMLMYAVFVNLWSSQQDSLRDAELRVALLTEQANCDMTTGLLNRRGLELAARGWLNRNQDFSVLLVQQDRYDALEATLSDPELQANMVALGKGIDATFGDRITVARWSEGTFMLLVHYADRVLVEKMAQELRRTIDAAGYSRDDGLGSICIGYTLASSSGTFDEAAARAEIALQTALETGNCVRALLMGS